MEQPQQNETFLIMVFNHADDEALFQELWPHLQLLEQCLPTTRWRYYTLPLNLVGAQKDLFQEHVAQSRVWVLCSSAALIAAFLKLSQQFPVFQETLPQVQVISLPLRACTYTDAALCKTPLAAVVPGNEQDRLCTQMAHALEAALQQHAKLPQNPWIEQLLEGAHRQREE